MSRRRVTPARYLGADLGGTQFRMAVVDSDGRLATPLLSVPTGASYRPADLGRDVAHLRDTLAEQLDGRIAALGMGTAGVVRPGPLGQATNLPFLKGVDLRVLLADAAGCPVEVENDARCFTLAEARFGAARGARQVAGVTLGTGVGCGVMVDGRLHRGATCEAGEVWRIALRGQPLEASLSGAGVVRHYHSLGGPPGTTDAAEVARAASAGDARAQLAFCAFAEDVAFLCSCIAALLDPEVVVLGGSLTRSRDLFEEPLREHLGTGHGRVRFAELGDPAGVIGAAALLMNDEPPASN